MRMLERLRERIALLGDDHQVLMIQHQTVSENRELMERCVLAKQLKINESVASEDRIN